ncbi:MAG: hypothetical protein ACRDHW_02785 [Ktedonobacteraceae bacterium]
MEISLVQLHSLLATWHQVNIKRRIQAEQAINHRTTYEFFPETTRRLPQHNLRDLALSGDGLVVLETKDAIFFSINKKTACVGG